MRIERFDLKAFGRFSDASIDFGDEPGRLHVVYGPNESGKSTSLRAITAWLFGIDNRSTDNYIHAYGDLRIGGRLVSDKFGVLECVRRKGTKRTLKSIDESTDVDEKKLQRMLGGMDQETFLRGFGLDRQRLIEGGRDIMCGEGDLGQILFSAGVGMRGLNEIAASLEKEKRALFLPTGQVPELNKVLSELKKLKSELAAQTLSAAELQRRGKELDEARQQADSIGLRRSDAQRKLTRAENLSKALPLAARRHLISERLKGLQSIPMIDDNFRQRRRAADAELQIANGQLQLLKGRLENVETQIDDTPAQAKVLQFAQRISQLSDMAVVCQDAEIGIPELKQQTGRLESDLNELLRKLNRPLDTDVQSLGPSEDARLAIQKLMDESLRLDELRKAKQKSREELVEQLTRLQGTSQTDAPKEPIGLAAVLKAYANPQRLVDDHEKAGTAVRKLEKKLESAFCKLPGFEGTVEDAKSLRLPLDKKIRMVGDELESAEQEVRQVRAMCEQLETELSELKEKLDEDNRASTVPTEQTLMRAREERDRLLDRLAKTSESEKEIVNADLVIDGLRSLVHRADDVVDAMRAEADIVARRSQAETEGEKISRRIQAGEEELRSAIDRESAAVEQWREMWREAGVEAGSPAEMVQWLSKYEVFSEVAEQQQAAIGVAEMLDSQLAEAKQSLRHEWNQIESGYEANDSEPENLLVLHAKISHVYEAKMAAFKLAEQSSRDSQRMKDELAKLERELSRLDSDWEDWQQRWDDAVASIVNEVASTPAKVREVLFTIDAAAEKSAKLNDCRQQIELIETRNQQLLTLVEELADDIGETLADGWLPQKLLGNWRLALQQAEVNEKQRASLSKQHGECLQEMNVYEEKANACKSVLQALCREAGCESADQLPELEQAAADKRELNQELVQVEHGLLALAGGEDLPSFCQEALQSDTSELEQTIEINQRELKESQASWEAAQQSVGALQRAYEEMDGSGRAAEINQQMQGLEAKAAKLAQRYAVLAIQQSVLGSAIESYRDKNQGPILSRAGEIFGRITTGRYRMLRPYLDEKNQRILLGVRMEGGKEVEVRANLMSEGTADALFLSLRLAGLETHVHEHAAVPLVMDDVLVQFDDKRSVEALRVLCEISQLTQVVFFTHHQHLVELVEQNLLPTQYKVHRLEQIAQLTA